MRTVPHLRVSLHTFRRAATLTLLAGSLVVLPVHADTTITACASLHDQTVLTPETFVVFETCPTPATSPPASEQTLASAPLPPAGESCSVQVLTASPRDALPMFAQGLLRDEAEPAGLPGVSPDPVMDEAPETFVPDADTAPVQPFSTTME